MADEPGGVQRRHLARVRAVLATFADDASPAEMLLTLEDVMVAVVGGIRIGLTASQIKRCSVQVIDEIIEEPPRR